MYLGAEASVPELYPTMSYPIVSKGLGKYLKRNMESVSGRKLRQSTYDAVVKLCEDKANTVFIVSGINDKGLMHVRTG